MAKRSTCERRVQVTCNLAPLSTLHNLSFEHLSRPPGLSSLANAMEPPPLKSPTKPPLITPSASPPPLRPPAHASLSHRMSESAPPLKRQRISSTPRRTINEASSSSTPRPQTPVDVQKEREASKLRLLEVWASLADRYTRRLDEDDLVDIHTGEITKDNGVLRNSRKFTFGALDAPAAGYTTADEGSDSAEEDEEDEYDLDELDAFADTDADTCGSERDGKCELEAGGKVVPPVTPLDPIDAEDLREFMDAERKRREFAAATMRKRRRRRNMRILFQKLWRATSNRKRESQWLGCCGRRYS
ncbi:hypothetical protein BDZ97DRAFT_1917003 [Flammula alnicola]|nr:hypothetical protein BDZ97DRAFT_1917003 [Flammula alnicola]